MDISQAAKHTKSASIELAALETKTKNKALESIAKALDVNRKKIIEANHIDIENSERNQLAAPLLKRLKFDDKKIDGVIDGIRSLINLPEPVGNTLSAMELDKELELYKVSCPIGVIGVIFESRPDALVQISTLCLKSGNGIMLKGGSEASNTNKELSNIINEATQKTNIPEGWIQLLETRSDVNEMLKMDDQIDLLIPRGSNEFVKYIMDHSNIPVLGHADGICHAYVDQYADIKQAVDVVTDSKIQYVAVCNALETLLVNENIAQRFLPAFKEKMDEKNVELIGCDKTASIIPVSPADENDWETEYLDYKLSVKIVKNTAEAIQHINQYGSGHTDTIITENKNTASQFINLVDSGNVFWNCSTRFSDGYRYGLGAEVGISTNKIHARGPVGLEGLLIYKWIIKGQGQTVQDYATGKKSFIHRQIDKSFTM